LRRAGKTWETYPMRKLILAATALAFLASTASAQTSDKTGGTTGPAAQSDNMSKGEMSKNKMAPKKKAKKSAKKSGEDTAK
jgi:predicted outer membrane protein